MVRYLITGGSGFIGRHVVHALRARGHEVLAPDHDTLDVVRGPMPAKAVDHVIHLAALSGVPDSWREPARFHLVNVQGSVNVMEYCRLHGCSLTLVSGYVYGVPPALPISEQMPAIPNNPYALTKFLAEEACRFYAVNYDVPTAILRHFNVYGPGQDGHFLIPHIIDQALDRARDTIQVLDLEPRRDYVYIDDVVDCIILASHPTGLAIYNVAGGCSYSVQDVISTVLRVAGVSKPIRAEGIKRPNEIPDVIADIGLIQRTFGWHPLVSLEEGIRRTIEELRRR